MKNLKHYLSKHIKKKLIDKGVAAQIAATYFSQVSGQQCECQVKFTTLFVSCKSPSALTQLHLQLPQHLNTINTKLQDLGRTRKLTKIIFQ